LKRLSYFAVGLFLIGAFLAVGFQDNFVQAQSFDRQLKNALETSFWYSYSNVESLLLNSGLGVKNEDLSLSVDDDLIKNLKLRERFPLQAPYLSGSPTFAQTPIESDPETLRWIESSVNEETTLETLSHTIIAELAWATRFNQLADHESGQASTFAAHQTQLFIEMAKSSAQFVEQQMKREDGLYWHSLRWWQDIVIQDEADDWRGQLSWLWALSSLMAFEQTHTQVELGLLPAANLGHALFGVLKDTIDWNNLPIEDASLAVKALGWFLVYCKDSLDQAEAIERLNIVLNSLAQAAQMPQPSATQASIISGLLQGAHLLGDNHYQTEALKVWQQLSRKWNPQWSVFANSESVFPLDLTLTQISEFLAAFHSLIYLVDDEIAKEIFPQFFGTLRTSKLLGAEIAQASNEFEDNRAMTTDRENAAPVFISHVRLTSDGWEVIDGRFRSTEALFASNWLLWMSQFQAEAFAGPPVLGLPEDVLVRQNQVPRRLQALSDSLKETQQQMAQLNQQLAQVNQNNGNSNNAVQQEALDQLALNMDRFQQQVQAELQTLQQRIEATDDDTQITAIQDQIRGLQNQLAPLDTQFNQLLPQIEQQNQRFSSLEQQIQTLQTDLTAEVQRFLDQINGQPKTDTALIDIRFAQLEQDLILKFDPLTESLALLDQQLNQTNNFQESFSQLNSHFLALKSRLDSLEQIDVGTLPLGLSQSELLLIGVLILGIVLVTIGLLRLRQQRHLLQATTNVISDAVTPETNNPSSDR